MVGQHGWDTLNKSAIKNENILKKELTDELHKLFIRNFKDKRGTLIFYWEFLGYNLADMQLIRNLIKDKG